MKAAEEDLGHIYLSRSRSLSCTGGSSSTCQVCAHSKSPVRRRRRDKPPPLSLSLLMSNNRDKLVAEHPFQGIGPSAPNYVLSHQPAMDGFSRDLYFIGDTNKDAAATTHGLRVPILQNSLDLTNGTYLDVRAELGAIVCVMMSWCGQDMSCSQIMTRLKHSYKYVRFS